MEEEDSRLLFFLKRGDKSNIGTDIFKLCDGPVSSKLILKHFGVMKIQVYSNEESHYFDRGYKSNKMDIL